jgi:carbonic anhydrase
MIEIVFRWDPKRALKLDEPETPHAAKRLLEEGNRAFAELLDLESLDDGASHQRVLPFDPGHFGLSDIPGAAPSQKPFAAILGCADARVPVEIVFEQGCNDLFVVRVAGNVIGAECLGSLRYAVHQFSKTLRLIVVLGHLHCGAVTAAVDGYLNPRHYHSLAPDFSLRSIVDQILPAVRTAALALESACGAGVAARPGYRAALIESAVVLNTAWAAFTLRQALVPLSAEQSSEVVFGVYDLASRYVRLPLSASGTDSDRGLFPAPRTDEELLELGARVAAGDFIRSLLDRQ